MEEEIAQPEDMLGSLTDDSSIIGDDESSSSRISDRIEAKSTKGKPGPPRRLSEEEAYMRKKESNRKASKKYRLIQKAVSMLEEDIMDEMINGLIIPSIGKAHNSQ